MTEMRQLPPDGNVCARRSLNDMTRLLNCFLMGGQSLHLGAVRLLMCHGQLSDTTCALAAPYVWDVS